MNRRQFFLGAAAVAVASALPNPAASPAEVQQLYRFTMSNGSVFVMWGADEDAAYAPVSDLFWGKWQKGDPLPPGLVRVEWYWPEWEYWAETFPSSPFLSD